MFKVVGWSVFTVIIFIFQGWHSVMDPIHLPHDFGETTLEKFCPVIARMTAIMKYNKHFNFNCTQTEFGEDYLTWLEEVFTEN